MRSDAGESLAVARWATEERARIHAFYRGRVDVDDGGSGGLGNPLIVLSDPRGQGTPGAVEVEEIRLVGSDIEFTVFVTALARVRLRRWRWSHSSRIHLWGVDVRTRNGTYEYSTDDAWRTQSVANEPVLRGGIDRLVSGDFRLGPLARLQHSTRPRQYGDR